MDDLDIKRLDHHGLVMGVIKDLGIIETLNECLGKFEDEKISIGDRIAAMVINGLGFTDQPLSLMPEYLEELPIEEFFGEGVKASDFDRFSLSRALDRINQYGEEQLFSTLAAQSCAKAGVERKHQSFDTTSFSLVGEYEQDDEAAIKVTHGYSKDHRPDLKQIITELLVSHDSGVPLVMQNWSGNTSDNEVFKQRTEKLVESFKSGFVEHITADSKFYTEENSEFWDIVKFTTRVPETIKLAKQKIQEANEQNDWRQGSDGKTQFMKYDVNHYNTAQRWLVCRSEQSLARANKSVEKAVEKEFEKIKKEVFHFQAKRFHCADDAFMALRQLTKKWKYHSASQEMITEHKRYEKRGHPGDSQPSYIEYQLNCEVAKDENKVESLRNRKACFVIATNMPMNELKDKDIIVGYKGQQTVERGYRFLKDPLFFTSAFFLKKPERISALIMVMTIALLIYSIAQKRLRQAMKDNEETLPNQICKQVESLTIRRAFQVLRGINFVVMNVNGILKKVVQGITETKERIIRLIAGACLNYYKLTPG